MKSSCDNFIRDLVTATDKEDLIQAISDLLEGVPSSDAFAMVEVNNILGEDDEEEKDEGGVSADAFKERISELGARHDSDPVPRTGLTDRTHVPFKVKKIIKKLSVSQKEAVRKNVWEGCHKGTLNALIKIDILQKFEPLDPPGLTDLGLDVRSALT